MTFERILSHFQVMKRGTGKAQCICPAHVDTEASLTLTDGNDRALIRCHILKLDNIRSLDMIWGCVRTSYEYQIKKEQEAENDGEV